MKYSKHKLLFNVSAIIEIITGISLVIFPGITVHYLLGPDLDPGGIAVARIAGIALISVGVSALEVDQPIKLATRLGLLFYNFCVVILLTVLVTFGSMSGMLIWPAIVLHLVITLMMVRSLGKTVLYP